MVCFVLFLFFVVNNSFGALKSQAAFRASRELPGRTQYEFTLDINPVNNTYTGHQKVTFTNRQSKATNYLLFLLYPNDPSLTKSQTKYMKVTNVIVNGAGARIEEKDPFLRVYLNKPLNKNESVTVVMDFSATVPRSAENKDLFSESLDELMSMLGGAANGGAGIQQSDYGIFSSNKDILNMGLWYPALAKYDQDAWDEEKYSGIGDVSYFDPADYSVTITAPASHQVVTTGSLLKQTTLPDGRIQRIIESKVTRDFAVELSAKYVAKTKTIDGTEIRSYYLTTHAESGQQVLDTAVRAFQYYSSAFGAYPYSELDVVEAPLFGGAGGVEFPELVTISEMLYQSDTAKPEDDPIQQLLAGNPMFGQLLEFVVAHEVAHQWWNAVVGSNSKKYPFIDEAMANYSAALYFEHYYGREAAEQQMNMQMKLNYELSRMLGGSDRPVILPTSAFNSPLEYAAIVYGKGALYFDQLRALLGDELFFAAMKEYYQSYWFHIAEPDSLNRIAVRLAPRKSDEANALFTRWLKETHGDEDIGQGSLEDVMKLVTGGNENIDPETLKELDQLLNQNSPQRR